MGKKGKIPFGYQCLLLETFCYKLPLRTGVYIIAALGFIPTMLCLCLASPVGRDMLTDHGVPTEQIRVLCYCYAAMGVVVFAAHIILLFAVVTRNKGGYFKYLLLMLFYMIGSFVLSIIVSVESLKSGYMNFGNVFFVLNLLQTLILVYFLIVVNSLQYVARKESNVINIQITII